MDIKLLIALSAAIRDEGHVGWAETIFESAGYIASLESENAALRQRVQELEEAQRWIPVTERLPDSNRDVLVTVDSCVEKAWYSNTKQRWNDKYGDCLDGVTAWCELPTPYEEAKNAH